MKYSELKISEAKSATAPSAKTLVVILDATPNKLKVMPERKKYKDAFRQFTMTFLMLVFCSFTVFSQVTKQQLDNFYKNNQTKELEQVFINLYNQTKTEFPKLSDNDTLTRINDIFNLILPDRQKRETVEYFFLQPNFPKTFIDSKELTFTDNFLASTTTENHRPIIYNSKTISEILKFIGSNPYDNPLVKEYLKEKEKMKKSKFKEAERLISEYKNKTKFIGQFLYLPATWGKMDRSLVPYKINSLKFNTDLTEVEVTYDLTWRGATETYKYIAGKWKLEQTKMKWIH